MALAFLCLIKVSKVGDCSREWPEGSLFNCYYTEVQGRVLLLTLDCSTLPSICTLYCWVLSKEVSSTILKSLVCRDMGLNPGLPDHWRTLYPLAQWAGKWNDRKRRKLGSYSKNTFISLAVEVKWQSLYNSRITVRNLYQKCMICIISRL